MLPPPDRNGHRRSQKRSRSVTMEVTASRQLGRYELAFELASGGFAAVYLARAKGPGGFEKYVALKRIHSHLATEREFIEMFLDEARIAACINHPNVCPVFDFGEADGAYYLAMDFVFGESLAAVYRALRRSPRVRQDPLCNPIIARIVAEAADGLHAAHEATGPDGFPLHVVHRDVAPANLFIRYDGNVQVVDFGIASAAGKMHMTATGVMKGHLAYVAPEQFNGEALDRRTDIWALGVVLWELLAGRRLYRRENDIKTMQAVLSEPTRSLRDFNPQVPSELEVIVRRALEKKPKNRFQTAREFSRALHMYLKNSGNVVTTHDIADWLEQIAPGARANKQKMLDQARAALEANSGFVLPLAQVRSITPPLHGGSALPEPGDRSESMLSKAEHSGPLRIVAWSLLALIAIGVGLVAALSL